MMQRRNFIAGTIGAATVFAIPFGHNSADCLAAQKSLNTFAQDDTLAQRVDKLNDLMGTRFLLHLDRLPEHIENDPKFRAEYVTTYMDYPSDSVFDADRSEGGMGDVGWRVSLWRDGQRYTGCMRLSDMFDWTAQVALGYRIAKAQAGQS
jgi:hypothetical protein